MSDEFGQTQMIDGCLARLQRGDQTAREELLNLAGDRLMRLTRKIKRTFKVVGRWEQTDDVFQNAALRL